MIKAYAHRFLDSLRSLGMTRVASLGMTFLAAFAVSCGKVEEPVVPAEPIIEEDPWKELCGDVPIRFATGVADTKTTSSLPTTTNFRVFAFYQPGVVDDDPAVDYTGTWNDLSINHWTPNFMYDEEVSYQAGMWAYNPVKYWPNNAENTLTFWAYSPYYNSDLVLREAGGTDSDLYGNTVPGIPDVKFTTDASRDLLISELEQDLSYRGGDPATVTLTFHHVMCWVDFTVTKVDPDDDYDMYLKSISIEDLFFTAVFSQNSDFSEARWLSPSGATDDISVFSTDAVPGVELSHSVALDYPPKDIHGVPERQIMPLPQRLVSTAANTPVLHVVYSFKLKGAVGEPATYESYYPLGRIHTRWEKEKHYTYNIHISPGVPLLFTASVVRWDNEQNGFFNVNN